MREDTDMPLLRFILILMACLFLSCTVAAPTYAASRTTRYFRRDSDMEGVPGPLNYPSNYVEGMLNAVNEYRKQLGLQTLEELNTLRKIAEEHAAYMFERRRISHDNFYDRFRQTNFRLCVENVASGSNPKIEAVLKAWIASPEHHRNLLEPRITRIGISYNQGYITYFACEV